MTRARFAVVVAVAVVVGGCGSSAKTPDAGGCSAYVSTANLDVPAVSFAGDVQPIFASTCAVNASCHGDPSVRLEQRPFLGWADADAGTTTNAEILAGLVGVKSTEDLAMSLVTAGDPGRSFLMHKLDDDQCTLISQCMMGASFRPNCGVFMPYQYPDVLDVATRDVVRRWIHQGALDN